MAKTNAQLTADLAKLTKTHEVMVEEAEKQKNVDALAVAILKKVNEKNEKLIEELKAAAEAAKAVAKKQREEKAEENVKDMKAKLDAEEHQWVQVYQRGLKDDVDFAFNYEGVQFVLYSGVPVSLALSVIKHLKGCGYPIITEKQGEAGQPVIVHGKHNRYSVVNCEKPPKAVKAAS